MLYQIKVSPIQGKIYHSYKIKKKSNIKSNMGISVTWQTHFVSVIQNYFIIRSKNRKHLLIFLQKKIYIDKIENKIISK